MDVVGDDPCVEKASPMKPGPRQFNLGRATGRLGAFDLPLLVDRGSDVLGARRSLESYRARRSTLHKPSPV
jgi:hypothetical protein